ncbi:hypothetical protein F5878DRAFT_335247 [Lentinula raphanica]|uniref:Uncharacterized protein n=1 Tax=Lentinula raphanica TaxID=153919 RepID=A0AA38P273_9AGAR|nr:hypothetical protein F5880DRAFT_975683 [Lentinula raphanica]KAJ3834934.1 hypothetical protein F5878DRAFT_335247 [Lentinula raphanica]
MYMHAMSNYCAISPQETRLYLLPTADSVFVDRPYVARSNSYPCSPKAARIQREVLTVALDILLEASSDHCLLVWDVRGRRTQRCRTPLSFSTCCRLFHHTHIFCTNYQLDHFVYRKCKPYSFFAVQHSLRDGLAAKRADGSDPGCSLSISISIVFFKFPLLTPSICLQRDSMNHLTSLRTLLISAFRRNESRMKYCYNPRSDQAKFLVYLIE